MPLIPLRSFVRPHVAAEMPRPESSLRKQLLHTYALVSLLAFAGYLVWRTTSTIDWSTWWVSLPLLIAETRIWIGLALFTMALWDIDVRPPWNPTAETKYRIAILIPTYNEPIEVVLPTIAAAVALSPEHETWVLDDGDREAVAELSEALGARYLARPSHEHAKAGNLNYALGVVEADLIGVLDADHAPDPNFLRHTLCYFDDPRVAIVQTPQDFYNADSFEHDRDDFMSQRIFYRAIAAGKNRWDAAFWAGTGAVLRVAALQEVGGVATDSITEDIMTTMRMQRRGWKTVYHNEVLARGLAASDARAYLVQRNRWARGAMQTIRKEGPLRGPGLSISQRLAYATTLFGWFDSWRMLNLFLLPVIVIITGVAPMSVSPYLFAAAFGGTTVMSYLLVQLLARGHFRLRLSMTFATIELPAVLSATFGLLGGRRRFVVTPKGRTGTSAPRVPRLLWFLLAVFVLAACWCVARLAGLASTYAEPWAVGGALLFDLVNLSLVVAAIRRIRSRRFAGERRAGFRFAVELPAAIDNVPCVVTDLSVTGAQAIVRGEPSIRLLHPGESVTLVVELPDRRTVRLECDIVEPSTHRVQRTRLSFKPGQWRMLAQLIPTLFANPSRSTDPLDSVDGTVDASVPRDRGPVPA